MRVALMLESDGPGGAEMMLVHLAEALRARGHEVCPVGPDRGEGWLGDHLRERGFRPRTFSLRRPLDWRCLRGLVRLFRTERIEVVHSHEFTMAVYGAAATRLVGLPQVVTMHGGTRYGEVGRRRAAMRWACRKSRAVVAVSHATRRDLARLLGIPQSEIHVVPNGIPNREGRGAGVRGELGLTETDPLVVCVGNLYAVKGHIVLLEAMAALKAVPGLSHWHLAIAGRGEEEATLRRFATEHGLEDRVHLLGYRRDVADVLAAADVFAMPSRSEGLPLALVEAMFATKPIVASRVGGIPEVIEEGVDGLLSEPGQAEPLAANLQRLLTDPGFAERLARAGAEKARRDYSLSGMAERYEALYEGGVIPE